MRSEPNAALLYRRCPQRIGRTWPGVVLAAWIMCLVSTNAYGQSAEDFTRLGNESYNSKKYSEAVAAYTRAIQAEPRTALRAYRNMARAYNMLQRYTESNQYYDWYLELAPDADDARKVQYEQKRVARKAEQGGSVLTEDQRAALERLQNALETGPYMTADGGAVALYAVLLRTGYATPTLGAIQQRLAAGLVDEAAKLILPAEGQPGPALDRAGWLEIQKRIDWARGFVGVTLPTSVDIDALESTVQGWDAYLRGDYDQAAASFAQAVKKQPALLAAQWGHLLSLIYANPTDLTPAFARFEAARTAYKAAGLETEPHFSLVNAVLLQASGKDREAVGVILGL